MNAESTGAVYAQNYESAKRVLVFGDTPAARWRGEDTVARLGARLGATHPIDDADALLARNISAEVVLVELHGEATDAVVPMLAALQRTAGRGVPSIVTVPLALLDLVTAHAEHRAIAILCDPHPLERAAALGVALAGDITRLNDMTADRDMLRLRQLSEEVGRIARSLATLSGEAMPGRSGASGPMLIEGFAAPAALAPEREIDASTIRTLIRARRLRDQYFDRELFADPAWDILLDLTAARIERTPVAVSSLCIAAAVPPTTALRWIKTLTEAGLLVRAADTRDGRRVFIELSEAAAAGMTAYLRAASRLGLLAI